MEKSLTRNTTPKRWESYADLSTDQLALFPDIHPLLVQLLHNRGVTRRDEIEEFLSQRMPSLGEPFLMKDMDRAVDRILKAIDQDEAIAVYGDFDVDGITSTVLVKEVLEALGAEKVSTYIPDRASQGYGLHCCALSELAERGVSLVITVDCGTSAEKEVAFSLSLGLDLVITDHHQVTKPLPEEVIVVNPRQDECAYPFKGLAGVGVAFKLAQGLLRRRQPLNGRDAVDMEASVLDLVALGTIADLGPLLGENRTLVRRGLSALNETTRVGLREMMALAGVKAGSISPTTVSFVLAPRLNAAGRIANADTSYRLLSTDSSDDARDLAMDLEEINAERKAMMAKALQQARDCLVSRGERRDLLLIAGDDYPAGIVGLVAGRLAEEYYRPVLVVETGETEGRGSARSIEGLNITEGLASCADLLVRYGGHAQAAGFTIANGNLQELDRRLLDWARDELAGKDLEPTLAVDAELRLDQVNRDLYELINRLAPFGLANPNPVFISKRVKVVEVRVVGRDEPGHLRLRLQDGPHQWTAIGFNLGRDADAVPEYIDLVYTIEPNEWNGNWSLDLHIRDWRPHI